MHLHSKNETELVLKNIDFPVPISMKLDISRAQSIYNFPFF